MFVWSLRACCRCLFHLPLLLRSQPWFSKPRPSRFGETRKRSVPVRVHSHSKELWFRRFPVARSPTSNPFLTHGTVESPAKFSLRAVPLYMVRGARPPPITSKGFTPTPLAG